MMPGGSSGRAINVVGLIKELKSINIAASSNIGRTRHFGCDFSLILIRTVGTKRSLKDNAESEKFDRLQCNLQQERKDERPVPLEVRRNIYN